MQKLVMCLTLIALVAVPFTVWAEDEAAPAAEKPVLVAKRTADPAAMKLIEAAQKKLYSTRAAGLESASYTLSLKHPMIPIPISFSVEYEAPHTAKVKLGELPAEMEPMRPMLEPQCAEMARSTVSAFRREGFQDIELFNVKLKEGTKNTVLITGFATEVKDTNLTVVFGENGLPTKTIEKRQGMESTFTMKYEEKDGKFLIAGGATESMQGAASVTLTHEKLGKYWLVTKQIIDTQMGAVELVISNYKVNGEAVAPAAKPEAATPEKPADDD